MAPQMCCIHSASECLLTRKKQQTRREVKRQCRTWHRSKIAKAQCDGGGRALLHSSFLFFVRSHGQQVALTPLAFLLADHRAHAWYIQFMAWWRSFCALVLSLVVQLSLLPRNPSNVRGCGIFMMYRLPARLSLIVVRRMSFVDQYFRCASGCRGVVRCLHTAWAWPARGKSRGRAGDAAGASIGRALPALLGAHVLHVLRGALF